MLSTLRKLATLTTFGLTTFGMSVALAPMALAQDTIVQYPTFTDPGNQETEPGETTIGAVTPIALTRNNGLVPASAGNSFSSSGWATNVEGTPTVVNEDGYLELGFTLAPGATATLDSFLLGSRSSNSGPSEISIFSSIDDYATPLFVIDQTFADGASQGEQFKNSIVDLSALGTISDSFTLRLMNTGGDVTANPTRSGEMDEFSTFRIGDYFDSGDFTTLQITGTVTAIPEPASLALLGLGGLAMVGRRRRSA